jgi:hypothetical protein
VVNAARVADDLANDVQPTVDEMVGAGHHHQRQRQWRGARDDLGQRHGRIFGSVDDMVSRGTALV